MGPEAAKRFPGHHLIRPDPTGERRVRAIPEIDDGRRGTGAVFGAVRPATGDAFTAPYPGRTIANGVAVLEQVDAWLEPSPRRVDALLDTLSTHRAVDVLRWALAHPRWEFVVQPTSAVSRNRIAPWGKGLRSLALTGRRVGTWDQGCAAVAASTVYWNQPRPPFVGGSRRKWRRAARRAGLAHLPFAP